ncbi:HD domain-containing protein [Blautia schinkii]|nr:HD domain-containing protein [Blautia schinkii]
MKDSSQYLRFIKEMEQLKNVTRTAWTSDGHRESTAEHTWRLSLLAGLMLNEFPCLDGKKVLLMALVHDIGELYDGDISAAELPDSVLKYKEESEAVQRAVSLLGQPLRTQITELWEEYEKGETEEARLVKALDKAETIIQHNQGQNPADFDYEFNLDYGKTLFKGSEILEDLRTRIDAETQQSIEKKDKR